MLLKFLSFPVPFVLALTASATLCIAAPASDLRLPHIFGNGMVLQQGNPVTVWGWAKPAAEVTIEFAGQTKSATAMADSKWTVQLDAMNASFTPGSLVVRTGDQKLTLDDVLVGEVWVCGGQSNMERPLSSTLDADIELVAADYPAIRFIRLPKVAHIEAQDDFPVENATNPIGNWRAATAKQVANCTGVGYYFARRLQWNLKVPIGIVDNSWGGPLAQNWCTKKSLAGIPEMREDIETFENKCKEWHGPVYEATTFADGHAIVTFKKGGDQGLRLDKDTELGFVVAGDVRPMRPNIPLVLKNFGDSAVSLELDGKPVPRGKDFRYSHEGSLDGLNLCVRIRLESVKPVRLKMSPK